MRISKKNLEKILPHDYPMILIDELLEVDTNKNTVCALVKITEDKILYDKTLNGISPLAGIEFMAQTAGCFAYYKNNQTAPRIGYLLGSRQYVCNIEKFEKDKTYTIKANQVFSDNELVSFDCFIYNDDIECAKATVNVFQPKDDATAAI